MYTSTCNTNIVTGIATGLNLADQMNKKRNM